MRPFGTHMGCASSTSVRSPRSHLPDLGAQEGQVIPLPNVSSSVMTKILEYCDHHKNEPLPAPDTDADDSRRKTAEIGEWDAKFIVSTRRGEWTR